MPPVAVPCRSRRARVTIVAPPRAGRLAWVTERLWQLGVGVGVLGMWIAVVVLPSPVVPPDFGSGDLFSYFLPAYQFVGERLREGGFAWWNPYTGGGVPLAATMQAGALYPARLLLLALDADDATQVSLIAHLVLAAVATFTLARACGASRWGAAAAAAAFVVPAELPHLYWPPGLEAGAWLPVAALAVTRLLDGGPTRWSGVLGVALGLPVVAGGYQTALMVGYGSAVVLAAQLAGGRRRLTWRTCGMRLAVAGLVAVAIAAPQLGITFAWTAETARTATALTDAQIQPWWSPELMGFLAREVLRQTVVSNGGLQTLYLSAPAVVLMTIGFLRGGRFGGVLGCAWAIFFLLTFGPGFPWFALYHWLPALDWFRLPQRLSFLVAFFGALGVALGMRAVHRRMGPGAAPWCDAAMALAVLAALLLPAPNGRPIPWTLPADRRVHGATVFEAAAAAVGDGRLSIQTLSMALGTTAFPRLGLARRVRTLQDYEPLAPRRLQDLLRAIAGDDDAPSPGGAMFTGTVATDAVTRPQLLDVAAVTTIVTTGVPGAVGSWGHVAQFGPVAVLHNPTPLPRAHLAALVRYADTEAEALRRLTTGAHDPHDGALLVGSPEGAVDDDPMRPPIVPLRIAADSPERVRVEVSGNRRGVVVLADAWAPGWSALVDGEPRRLWQANYFGRGVIVEPGDTAVEFVYQAPGLPAGLWIALAALGAAGLLVRTRPGPEPAASSNSIDWRASTW